MSALPRPCPCAARESLLQRLTQADTPRCERITLPSGRRVTLRPVEARDLDAAQRFFLRLSPRSRLLRFHGVVNQLPQSLLQAMTQPDPKKEVALVAEASTDDGLPLLVADARYVRSPDGDAEFAVAVADDWRREGLARELLQRLGRHARRQGVRTLHGSVMQGNEPMLALMRGFGAEFRPDFDDAATVITQMTV